MRSFPFIAVQAVWGFPQTLAGCAVCLAHRERPHFRYHGAVVTTWENARGMSLGPFIFVKGAGALPAAAAPDEKLAEALGVDPKLLVHEYGHCIQSLILGPLYLPLVGLPSLVWSNVPAFERRRQRRRTSYYSFAPERTANWLGERVTAEPSIGQPRVDSASRTKDM